MTNLKIFHCLRCNSDVKVPFFTNDEKEKLKVLANVEKKVSAIEEVRKISGLDLKESKTLIIHLNKFGHCIRCDNNDLIGENLTCPKCKSFNLNWN
jgi:ribosomal protein L7/L12